MVTFSRRNDWASSSRSSAIVCACLAGDVFFIARRGFTLVLLESFLVVFGINNKRDGETDRGGKLHVDNRGAPRKQLPPAAKSEFYFRRLVTSTKKSKLPIRSNRMPSISVQSFNNFLALPSRIACFSTRNGLRLDFIHKFECQLIAKP